MAERSARDRWVSLGVFVVLFCAYAANGDFLPCSDATATTYLPVRLLSGDGLSFTAESAPWMFEPGEDGLPRKRGSYLVPTVTPGEYANTFGFGTAATALPVFVVARAIWGRELSGRHDVIWSTAKLAASAMVAGSGVFVFLAARRFAAWPSAVFVALTYGLGTCVWTLSSQALWQHPASELFLALGAWLFVRGWSREPRAWTSVAGAAAAWSWAVACRPTNLMVLGAAAVGLAIYHRKLLLPFVVAALPVGLLLAIHNAVLFGSPVRFGQTVHTATATEYLARKGVDSPWTWAVWDGAAGLLMSPSRGLLVYSPFVVLALIGLVRSFRHPSWTALRPLAVTVLAMWLVAFAWFDWWGGWSYGYRPIVDTMPLLALFLLPALPTMLATAPRRVILGLLVVVSVAVQALGAFTHNARGWNERAVLEVIEPGREPLVSDDPDEIAAAVARGGEVTRGASQNVDLPEFRHRLWSVPDSQILYYATYPERSRTLKKADQAAWLEQFE